MSVFVDAFLGSRLLLIARRVPLGKEVRFLGPTRLIVRWGDMYVDEFPVMTLNTAYLLML